MAMLLRARGFSPLGDTLRSLAWAAAAQQQHAISDYSEQLATPACSSSAYTPSCSSSASYGMLQWGCRMLHCSRSSRGRHTGLTPLPGHGPHSQAGGAWLPPLEQRRCFSEPAAHPQQPPQEQEKEKQPDHIADQPSHDVHYLGPLSHQHKLLKRISISNTVIAMAAAPAIVHYADNISLVSRYGLAASLVIFGILTTGALHWVAHPYVHELKYTAATRTIDVRTTTLLGASRWHSFQLDDVQPLPWSRPVATFMAKGQFYYIDVYSFPDADLLKRLTPDEASVPPGYKDDKDDDDD